MQDDISPEEKLLNIISKNKKIEPSKPSDEKTKNVPVTNSEKSNKALELVPLKRSTLHYTSGWRLAILSLRSLCLLAFIVLIYQLGFGKSIIPYPQKSILTSKSFTTNSEQSSKINEQILQNTFSGKNIFKTFVKPTKTRTSKQKSVTLADLLKNLNLSGIISGDNPQAIIEDRVTKQLHYVEKGSKIGELEIVVVENDRVRVRYGAEEAQLTL